MTKTERLKEIQRRLGSYITQGSDEPFRLNDAELARRLVELIELVMEIVDEPAKSKSRTDCPNCGNPGGTMGVDLIGMLRCMKCGNQWWEGGGA